MASKPVIKHKQGDTFSLDLTVVDRNNEQAIEAKTTLTAAELAYTATTEADPQVPADIAAALIVLQAAQAAYIESITVDITNWTISSHVAWCGKLITDLTVSITDGPAGTFSIAATRSQTELWKPRIHECDIEFNATLFGRQSSQTFNIDVQRSVTNVIEL